jgi:hypothetical protein
MTELLFLEDNIINIHYIVAIEKSYENEYFNQPAYKITLNIENYRTCPITQETKLFNTKEIWFLEGSNNYFAIKDFIENKRKIQNYNK